MEHVAQFLTAMITYCPCSLNAIITFSTIVNPNFLQLLVIPFEKFSVIDKMEEINNKHRMTEEALINMCGEKPVRYDLYDALEALKTAYEAAAQENVERNIRKQITLKFWFM